MPGKRILIVDDEAAIRGLLTEYLTGLGFETAIACNGLDALEQVRTFDPDLLIIDLVMPEQEGIETIQMLRRSRPGLKTIAISGQFGASVLRAAEYLGADASLAKPVQPDELLQAVARVMQGEAL